MARLPYARDVSERPFDVVIVGGGVAGLVAATACRMRNMSVAVIDPGDDSGASWAAAGMLSPSGEVSFTEPDVGNMMKDSFLRWSSDETWSRWFIPAPTIYAGWTSGDWAEQQRFVETLRDAGYECRNLAHDQTSRMAPGISHRLGGAVAVAEEGVVDTHRMLTDLRSDLSREGVAFVPARVISVSHDDERHTAHCHDGSTVNARLLIETVGVSDLSSRQSPAIRPQRGVTLHLVEKEHYPAVMLRCLVESRPTYLLRRGDGNVVIGATADESGEQFVDAHSVDHLLHDALTLVPSLREAEFVGARSGLRPVSPDLRPFALGNEGTLRINGLFRHGYLLSPWILEQTLLFLDAS